MGGEVNMFRLKVGTKSDADAAAKGDGAELPVPVRRSSTLDGLLNGFTDFKDAVARRPPTLRAGSRLGAEDLVVPEERPFDPVKAANARWKAMVTRNPTVVTSLKPLAPDVEKRRALERMAMERTSWQKFCDAVRERPSWMEVRYMLLGAFMLLFSITFLAYAIRVAGI